MLVVVAEIHPDTMRSVCHFHKSAASRKKAPLQLPSSGQCAPQSSGVECPPSHRGRASRPAAAKAVSDGSALVETRVTGRFVNGSKQCAVPPRLHRYPPRVVVRQPCLVLTYICCGQGS